MVPLLLILGALTLIAVGYWRGRKSNYAGEAERVIGWVVLFFIIVVAGIIYTDSMATVAKLDAFYSSTRETYANVITESETIEIDMSISVGDDVATLAQGLAYFQLAFTVSDRIREFGKEIANYNKGLYVYRKYNDNWFTDGFVANVPEYLKPIVLNLSK